MSKFPHWFPLDIYQQDLSPSAWSFEIFIRLNHLEKVDFIASNLLPDSGFESGILQLFSRTLSNFLVKDAQSIIRENKDGIFEDLIRSDKIRNSDWWINLEKSQNSCTSTSEFYKNISRHFESEFNLKVKRLQEEAFVLSLIIYLETLGVSLRHPFECLANGPLHLYLDGSEREHLYQIFLRKNQDVRVKPLIFSGDLSAKNTKGEVLSDDSNDFVDSSYLGHRLAGRMRYIFTHQRTGALTQSYLNRSFKINYAFSDKEILDAVENYLKESRCEIGVGRNKILKQLPNWKENQILALWDLIEWSSKVSRKKYTKPEMANALWPPFSSPNSVVVDYVERIRKLSIRDMKLAMTEKTYLLLMKCSSSTE